MRKADIVQTQLSNSLNKANGEGLHPILRTHTDGILQLNIDDIALAKRIIMIYELHRLHDATIVKLLRQQFNLHVWRSEELIKEEGEVDTQMAMPTGLQKTVDILEELINFETKIFARHRQFIQPNFLDENNQVIQNGWARLRKLLDWDLIVNDARTKRFRLVLTEDECTVTNDMIPAFEDLFKFHKVLSDLNHSFHFMEHPTIKTYVNQLKVKDPVAYFRLYVHLLYLMTFDPECPSTFMKSVLPCLAVITSLSCTTDVKNVFTLIQRILENKNTPLEDSAIIGFSPSIYFNECSILPLQHFLRYALILDNLHKTIPPTHTAMPQISADKKKMKIVHARIKSYSLGTDEFAKIPRLDLVPKYMQKYNLSFNQAFAWRSRDLQNWFLYCVRLERKLPRDILIYIATYLVPVSFKEASNLFNNVTGTIYKDLFIRDFSDHFKVASTSAAHYVLDHYAVVQQNRQELISTLQKQEEITEKYLAEQTKQGKPQEDPRVQNAEKYHQLVQKHRQRLNPIPPTISPVENTSTTENRVVKISI